MCIVAQIILMFPPTPTRARAAISLICFMFKVPLQRICTYACMAHTAVEYEVQCTSCDPLKVPALCLVQKSLVFLRAKKYFVHIFLYALRENSTETYLLSITTENGVQLYYVLKNASGLASGVCVDMILLCMV